MTVQVGRLGRPVDEVAAELGWEWHAVNNGVVRVPRWTSVGLIRHAYETFAN